MTESGRAKGFIAVLAAYVVALQALLLPLSVAAGAPLGASLCLSAASSSGSQPADHSSGCPCAAGCGLQCCAQTSVLPPQIVIARMASRFAELRPAQFGEPLRPPSDFDPHRQRGPPAA